MKTNSPTLLANALLVLTALACWGWSTADAANDASGAVPLDGRGGGIIAYSVTYTNNTNAIFLINADGSGGRQLNQQGGRPLGPSWSPDAACIAYYNHSSEQKWPLLVMAADGRNPRLLTDEPDTLDWCPCWSPDGRRILFTRSHAMPQWRSELWTVRPDGSQIRKIGNMAGQGASWSPDGKKIVYFDFQEGGGDIWIMNSDGSNIKKLTDHTSEDWWPNWSPDGRRIAFQSKRDGNFEIYTMNANGGNLVRLTNNPADDEEPKWSPDGRKIAFSSTRDGHYEIYIMNHDGSNQKRLTWVEGQAINPAWKPTPAVTNIWSQ